MSRDRARRHRRRVDTGQGRHRRPRPAPSWPPRPTRRRGWSTANAVEMDADALIDVVRRSIAAAVAERRATTRSSAVGVTGVGESGVLLDRARRAGRADHRLVRPARRRRADRQGRSPTSPPATGMPLRPGRHDLQAARAAAPRRRGALAQRRRVGGPLAGGRRAGRDEPRRADRSVRPAHVRRGGPTPSSSSASTARSCPATRVLGIAGRRAGDVRADRRRRPRRRRPRPPGRRLRRRRHRAGLPVRVAGHGRRPRPHRAGTRRRGRPCSPSPTPARRSAAPSSPTA